MSSSEFSPGLAGVVAFETEIAEPDKEGSALRYRGVDIEELAGIVPFEQVWGLVVNESLANGLPLPLPDTDPVSRSGDVRVDLIVAAREPDFRAHLGHEDEARDPMAPLSGLPGRHAAARSPATPPLPLWCCWQIYGQN